MSDDLVARLRHAWDERERQLAEDEWVALAVIEVVGPERTGEPYTDGSGVADRDAFPSYPWGGMDQELDFMAGPGHPARVLAEVERGRRDLAAKRRILDACTTDIGYEEEGMANEVLRLLAEAEGLA